MRLRSTRSHALCFVGEYSGDLITQQWWREGMEQPVTVGVPSIAVSGNLATDANPNGAILRIEPAASRPPTSAQR